MIHDLKPYPAMKESGLPWLGEVPQHWSVLRIKSVLREIDARSRDGKGTLLSLTRMRGLIARHDLTDKAHSASTLVGYKRYQSGQLVMNRMQAWSGMFGTATMDGLVSPDYAVFEVLGKNLVHFVLARLKSPDLVGQFALESKGIGSGFNRLYTDRFGPIPITVPPPSEQAAIVKYLNWATGRIDRAIRAKKKIIALLNEQKQVVIHHAVTRGFDPNVQLKPSRISWLGDIPQHWEVRRLKYLAKMQSGDGITSMEIDETGQYPVYGGNGLRGYTERFTHEGHHVLIGRQGALCGNINFAKGKFYASEHAVVVTTGIDVDVEWFGELLRVMNLNQYSQSAAQPGLSVERIKNLWSPLPPKTEQELTIRQSVARLQPMKYSIAALEKEIMLLIEYRTRLASDAVTGKVDVRDIAATLPEIDGTAMSDEIDHMQDVDHMEIED